MEDDQNIAALVLQSLQKGQLNSVIFMIEDEPQETIKSIKNLLKDPQEIKLFDEAIRQTRKNKQKEQYDDKIRQINAEKNASSSDESDLILITKGKKKIQKLQQKFGYPFYGVVKCLIISNGDLNPQEQTIKMMHSQIQTLFSNIFPKTMAKLTIFEARKYLTNIFDEEVKNYEEFEKIYKKATKGTKKKEESDDDFPEDSDDEVEIDHAATFSEQQKKYFARLTSEMRIEQYEKYTEIRSYHFLNNKKSPESVNKFKNFVDVNSIIKEKNIKILNLLSFICCRFIRKIIFSIIRNSNTEQKLVTPKQSIQSSDVIGVGNEFIDRYTEKMKKIIEEPEKVDQAENQKAKEIFLLEFYANKYREVLPRRVIINAQKEGEENLVANIWKQNKHYQKMWVERLNAEKQVLQSFQSLQNGNMNPSYEYTKFILKNHEIYKEKGPAFLWRKYFTHEPIEEPVINVRKRVKLESLNS